MHQAALAPRGAKMPQLCMRQVHAKGASATAGLADRAAPTRTHTHAAAPPTCTHMQCRYEAQHGARAGGAQLGSQRRAPGSHVLQQQEGQRRILSMRRLAVGGGSCGSFIWEPGAERQQQREEVDECLRDGPQLSLQQHEHKYSVAGKVCCLPHIPKPQPGPMAHSPAHGPCRPHAGPMQVLCMPHAGPSQDPWPAIARHPMGSMQPMSSACRQPPLAC